MRLSKKFAAGFSVALLSLAGLTGCSGSGDDNAKPEATEEQSASSDNAKCAGCTEPVGGFKEGEYGHIVPLFMPYKDLLYVVWDAPNHNSDKGYPEVNASDLEHSPSIHYQLFASGDSDYPEIDKSVTAKDAFTTHSDLLVGQINLHYVDRAPTALNESSGADVKVGQWTMYRSEGTIPCDDYIHKDKNISTLDYVGYALVLDGTGIFYDGEDGKTLAWFVVVDNPEKPVGKKVLSDIAKKTAESFRISERDW